MKRAAEFFAGIGLVRIAMEDEGWRVVYANDIDERKRMMYDEQFGAGELVCDDIRNIHGSDVPNIQLATASFPCIDLSLAGNRAGLSGDHSSMFWEFARILKEMTFRKPKRILLENVSGLLTSHGGRDLAEIIFALNRLGYACDLALVDAAHFVPQSRPRLFITGRLGNDKSIVFEQHPARPKSIVSFIMRHQDLKWAMRPLPPFSRNDTSLEAVLKPYPSEDPLWWEEHRKQHLYSQMAPIHRSKLSGLMAQRRWSFATVYKRIRDGKCRAELRIDGKAGCLRTPRGGSSKQFVIQAGYGTWRVRNMTPREYAALQGAPDYKITVPENVALLGFGDAVCVQAVRWVLRNLIGDRSSEKEGLIREHKSEELYAY